MRLFSDVSQYVRDPWLRYALGLAERGRGTTSPNPLVGCVVVDNEGAVGEGFHERAGGPHAEIVALGDAGERARGATVYVTLEPCAHQGLTPPCVDALLEAGVERVVIGMRDPNPKVPGGGADRLREAGIDTVFADDPWPFAVQNEAWLKCLATQRPFVRAKVAVSLDGHTALETGRRAAMTGHSGEEVTRFLRARADAVLVGAATVEADDPALTVRDADGRLAERQPRRVILCRDHVPELANRVFVDGTAETVVMLPDDLDVDVDPMLGRGTRVERYASSETLEGALRKVAALGVVDLLVEPGARLFSALWCEDLIDELIVVSAGGVAGNGAPPLFWGPAERTHDRLEPRMRALEAGVVGDVAVNVWRPTSAEIGTNSPVARNSSEG